MPVESKKFAIGTGKGVAFTDPFYAEQGELPWCAYSDPNCNVSGYELEIHYTDLGDYAIIIAPSNVMGAFEVNLREEGLAVAGPALCDQHVELGMDLAAMYIGFDDALNGIPIETFTDGTFGDLYFAPNKAGGFGFGFIIGWVDPDVCDPSDVIESITYNFDAK